AAAHDGEDLYRLGLANAVVEDGDVLSEARSLAVRLSGHSPAAVSATKAMIASCWPLGGFEALVARLKTAGSAEPTSGGSAEPTSGGSAEPTSGR
ncbi:MAG: hypothetical protein ACYCTI_03270, partial [Acidimicrobiales bacterium]